MQTKPKPSDIEDMILKPAFEEVNELNNMSQLITKITELLPKEKEKSDLSHCKKWYEDNACGSCGEIRGNELGYNKCLSDIKQTLPQILALIASEIEKDGIIFCAEHKSGCELCNVCYTRKLILERIINLLK